MPHVLRTQLDTPHGGQVPSVPARQAFRSTHARKASKSFAPALSATSRSVRPEFVVERQHHPAAVVLVRRAFVVQSCVVAGRPSPLEPARIHWHSCDRDSGARPPPRRSVRYVRGFLFARRHVPGAPPVVLLPETDLPIVAVTVSGRPGHRTRRRVTGRTSGRRPRLATDGGETTDRVDRRVTDSRRVCSTLSEESSFDGSTNRKFYPRTKSQM